MSGNDLHSAAQGARERAYAIYSKYPVGAALLDSDGRVWSGCNVENVSFGLTICAERCAILAMVAAGSRRWVELAVVTKDGGMPCGACLQVLAEFAAEEAVVTTFADGRQVRRISFAELFPFPFKSEI